MTEVRCEHCEDEEYPCPDCDEVAYMQAGQRDLERDMRARANELARRGRSGRHLASRQ